jgi:RNA polymerase sigma factor (sigma-70 family)
MSESESREFEARVLPHLDSAYNLARWLVRDASVAEDMVQDASIRAFRYLHTMRSDQARAWFLTIVRNTCFTWLEEQRSRPGHIELDDEVMEAGALQAAQASDPANQLNAKRTGLLVDAAISALAPPFREVIVLREIEGLSYAEIAQVAGIPIGTVMSRLSRARDVLRAALAEVGKDG